MQKELKTDLTITAGRAGIQAIPIILVIVFFYISIFYLVCGGEGLKPGFTKFMHYYNFIPVFIGGIIVHEILHGITWKIFGNIPLRNIIFGFHTKSLTPYAHCSIPIKMSVYKIGLLIPTLLLGFIPVIIAIVNNNTWLLYFGILFSIAGSVDLLVLWKIYDVKHDKLVQDHPVKAGCTLVD